MSEPIVDEVLRPDDFDNEPMFIEGDSDDDNGPVPSQQGGESNSDTQGSHGSSTQADFEVGQTFPSKEVVVIAVKNYSVHVELSIE
ncbi:hypothetical protein PIB30_004078 [Stylosanthes scabra]|uniref:Uncharacterized protein n=1 Tax=Stylosanthes scabra TaxID=79078 RepID=A0ABU6Z099_9FABA|nr:hypothetical protein [Stylosanthes scabra]